MLHKWYLVASQLLGIAYPTGSLARYWFLLQRVSSELEEAAKFVRELLSRAGSVGSAAALTSLHGTLADDGSLSENDDCDSDLGRLFKYGTQDPRSGLKVNFNRLCVACKQSSMAKSGTMADIVAMA